MPRPSTAAERSLRPKSSSGSTSLKERWDKEYETWQHSLGDLRSEVGTLEQRAETIEAALPEQLSREFHRIFKQRQGVAMAKVANDTCSACRSRIRPALFQQLKRGDLVYCEGCHRILYLEPTQS